MKPDTVQVCALESRGWRKDNASWRMCRVCHTVGTWHTWGWSSPNYSFYHAHCVLESGIAKKAIREAIKEATEVVNESN